MWATVSLYKLRPGTTDEATRRIESSYMQLVRKLEGWRGYELIRIDPDSLVTISYWSDPSVVDSAVERIWPWRDANLADFILEGPDKGGLPLMSGDVLISERRLA